MILSKQFVNCPIQKTLSPPVHTHSPVKTILYTIMYMHYLYRLIDFTVYSLFTRMALFSCLPVLFIYLFIYFATLIYSNIVYIEYEKKHA